MSTVTAAQLADQLNQRTLQILAEKMLPNEAPHAVAALRQAAREAGLEEVAAREYTSIWRAPDGTLVHLWHEGNMSQAIEDGGAGFDDQVEPGDLKSDDDPE